MLPKTPVPDLINLFEALKSSSQTTKMDGQNGLLPSPWAEMSPTLSNPFALKSIPVMDSESTCDHPSPMTSRTSSATCSPTSSPRSTSYSRRFAPSFHRDKPWHSASSIRLPSLLIRRRPSSVDLALDEERFRCIEDNIEKHSLGLMEPRPVAPIPAVRHIDSNGLPEFEKYQHTILSIPSQQPRFVMGGIREVMEGLA
ncbi:hypothetical protein FQN57_006876 [Myotisia sp. PD_48]|nr:hypothetical protein FQN57_006876 [Myotisia sp. PD_48]